MEAVASTSHRPPSHFLVNISPSTIENEILKIPPNFVKDFRDELNTFATLTVPYGGTWKVEFLKAEKESIWFSDGWENFVKYYSISAGHFLVFRYERNSTFHVVIFYETGSEIKYPSSKNVKMEDHVEVDDTKRRENAIQKAKVLMYEDSSFMAVMNEYNIRLKYVYVPKEFSSKHLAGQKYVNLQTADGKQWRAECYRRDSPSFSIRIEKGWAAFSRDNLLEEGDVCVFKVIMTSPVVLAVSIFRCND